MSKDKGAAESSPEARWRAAVVRTLNGAGLDTLTARSADGLPVGPLYPKADGPPGPWRDSRRPVGILPRLDDPDPREANRQAHEAVTSGASGLTLCLAGRAAAEGRGLAAAGLATLLGDLPCETLALRLDLGASAQAAALAEAVGAAGLPPGLLDIDVGLDPLGGAAPALTGRLRDAGFRGPLWRADGRPFHAAGASEAQELAAVLGSGLEALRLAADDLDAARGALSFTLAADADQIMTIAKFRALRRLWARIEQGCGLVPRPIRLHGETAWRMMAAWAPHTNLPRLTIACAAAILGGADSLTTLPFTDALGPPDALARRLARTIPLVLLQEAHLGRLADPAAGAGAFEALTDALCLEAWRLFQDLERQGGLASALRAGHWQAAIAAVSAARQAAHAGGDAPLVGVTAFTGPGEVPRPAAPLAPSPQGLPVTRTAAPFEAGTAL